MSRIELAIDDRVHAGWTRAGVTRSIEALAWSFSLSMTERWPGRATLRPIRPGAACVLSLDGRPLISGHLDEVRASYDAASHGISARGRDRCGDLVDASAATSPGEWHDLPLVELARAIAAPFGIEVSPGSAPAEAFPAFRIQEGETAFEAIERACRMRAVLPISDGRGGLSFLRAEAAPATGLILRRGEHILSAEATYDHRDRHSRVTVKAQSSAWDDAEGNALGAGSATDPAIRRHRPLILLAEDLGESAPAGDRASWEVAARRGRGRRISITLAGWTRPDGGLWAPGMTIRVEDDWLRLDDDLLIVTVTLGRDDRGTRTRLDLAPREAFSLLAQPEEEIGW